ncbi:MAG: cyclic nucleotide-binding domain-containing protein, partial [Candidatus Sericytochromatia bacterium]
VGFPRLFHLIRHLDLDHQRLFKQFRERKTELAQDQLRIRINETQIQKFTFFEGAEPAFFEAFAESVHAIAYLPDQELCQRGESGDMVYLILEGNVGIQRRGESGPALNLGEGEFFGEMAVLLEQPRSATVRTLDYCKFFVIEEPALRALGVRFPWFWERLTALATERQRANDAEWHRLEAQAGLDRPDLPTLELPAGIRSDDELLFLPSLHHDAIIGLTQQGEVLWFWGREATRQLFHPSRIQRLEKTLLVADTGNDRILEIDIASRKTLRKWAGPLKHPRSAALTPEGLLLVADEGNQRLVVIDESGREVWQYGLPEEIMQPVHVEITPAGTLLFTDAGMHRVYELSLDGRVLWTHGKWRSPGSSPEQLREPSWAHRLKDGSTLIADAGNQRLVWLEPKKPPHLTPLSQLGDEFMPRHCQRLADGDWLVLDPAHDRAVRLNKRGELIWEVALRFPERVQIQPAAVADSRATADSPWVLDMSIFDTADVSDVSSLEVSAAPELPATLGQHEDRQEALRPQNSQEAGQVQVQDQNQDHHQAHTENQVDSQAGLAETQTELDLRMTALHDLRDLSTTQQLFWKEIGIEIPSESPGQSQQAPQPELLPELDDVLEQVAEDLEHVAEQDAWEALAFLEGIEGLEGADSGATMILKPRRDQAADPTKQEQQAAEPEAEEVDKVDDFLDFLMSAPLESPADE